MQESKSNRMKWEKAKKQPVLMAKIDLRSENKNATPENKRQRQKLTSAMKSEKQILMVPHPKWFIYCVFFYVKVRVSVRRLLAARININSIWKTKYVLI